MRSSIISVVLLVIFCAVVFAFPSSRDGDEDEELVRVLERRGNKWNNGNKGNNGNGNKKNNGNGNKGNNGKAGLSKAEKEALKLQRWNQVNEMLEDKSRNWKMDHDSLDKHYSKKMQQKLANGQKLSRSEVDTFENEYGSFKNRSGISVIDLLIAINQARDVQEVDEADIKKSDPPKHLRNKRDAKFDAMYLWIDRTVPYEFTSDMLESRDIIMSAMNEIASLSCIRFVERSTQANWIQFVKKSGCWSSVGRNFWIAGPQEISLGNGCVYKGTIMHELFHALGFYHEQSRFDRDNNIEILWENIPEVQQHNFAKQSEIATNDLGAPYDDQSIMHYGKYAFSASDQPTILKLTDPSTSLGQRDHLSATDVDQLNKLYSCQVGGTGWSAWSKTGPCDLSSTTSCTKKRQRFCMDPNDKTSCPGPVSTALLAWGVDEEKISCSCSEPRAGHWGKWGSWGSCSVSCDEGMKSRTRTCDDPSPKNGGDDCPGASESKTTCVLKSCNAGPFDSDFETTSVWTADPSGNFQWTQKAGSTPSSSTGPSGDHTSGTGNYMFIETSSPQQTGWRARLMSPSMSGLRCMSLWYHMYGQSTGSLKVFVNDGSDHVVFSKSGDQLNQWHFAKFDIDSSASYKVIIEGVKGSSFQGDSAIDDIVIKEGSCFAPPPTLPPTVPEFVPVGCYHDKGYIDGKRPFSDYKSLGHLITKWSADFAVAKSTYYNDIIVECSAHARSQGFQYFAIQNHYECWTGSNEEINYGRDGESTGCYPTPALNLGESIIGQANCNMVYRWEG